MMAKRYLLFLSLLLLSLAGCRGQRSADPAIHLNPNFDWNPKYKAQRYTQPIPAGTVSWGSDAIYDGNPTHFENGKPEAVHEGKITKRINGRTVEVEVSEIPVPVTPELMKRGQERYDIYCGVCHDKAGTGKGMVVKRGFLPPPNLGEDRLVDSTDGYLYNVITHGVRNMPAYGKQIPVNDRWAIVAYVRALQKMQHGTLNDVPENRRAEIQP